MDHTCVAICVLFVSSKALWVEEAQWGFLPWCAWRPQGGSPRDEPHPPMYKPVPKALGLDTTQGNLG